MKILVTGANGYLGAGVVKKLLDDGQQVVATDIVTDRCDERAERISCDIFSVENPYEFFGKPEAILHLAWRDGFIHNSESHIIDLPKHFKFLQALFNSDIEKVAVMGSMHEIGFYEGCIDENTPCNPQCLYGIAKNTLRQAVEYMASASNKQFQWLRGYYIVSDTAYGSSIFSKLYKAATVEGKKEFPFTMGTNKFDFVDYADFCNKTASAVEQSEINGIINICSGKPVSLADRVEQFIKDNQLGIKLLYGAFPDREYDSKAIWGDSTKIDYILSHK